MTRDPLHDLLAHADEAAPVPALKPGLVGNIRMRARRRTIRRNTMLALGAIIVTGFGVARMMPHAGQPVNTVGVKIDVVQIRNQVIALETEARGEKERADTLLQHQTAISRSDIDAAYLPPINPLDRVNAARNRAALILLRQADSAQSPAEAGEIRSSIVRLFPETPAGHVAQQRLKSAGSSI